MRTSARNAPVAFYHSFTVSNTDPRAIRERAVQSHPCTCTENVAQGAWRRSHDVPPRKQALCPPTAIRRRQSPSFQRCCAIRTIAAWPSSSRCQHYYSDDLKVSVHTTLCIDVAGLTSTLWSGNAVDQDCCSASISSPVESASHGFSSVATKLMYDGMTCPRQMARLFLMLGRGTSLVAGVFLRDLAMRSGFSGSASVLGFNLKVGVFPFPFAADSEVLALTATFICNRSRCKQD